MRTARGRRTVVLLCAGQVVEFGLIDLIQPDLNCLDLTLAVSVRKHNAGCPDVKLPSACVLVSEETRHTFQLTAPVQQFRYDARRPDSRRCFISEPDDIIAGESPQKQGLSVRCTEGQERKQIAIRVISSSGICDRLLRIDNYRFHNAAAGRLLAV